jgi:glutamate transport system permease protein
VRSGINSVSRGQVEAARALGLTFPQVLRLVVMPQALRTVVGPLGGIFIALLKNSGVSVAIAVPELTSAANAVGTDTARFIPAYLGAAIAYLMLTVPSGFATGWLERKVAIKR